MTTCGKKFFILLLMTAVLMIAFNMTVFAATQGLVNVDGLNIRLEPNRDSAVLGRFNTGQAVELLGSENGFFEINYQGTRAYISAEFVDVVNTHATISGDAVNIRDNPSMDSKVLERFNSGQGVTAIGIIDEWVRIEHNGDKAYVNQNFISGNFVDGLMSVSPSAPPVIADEAPLESVIHPREDEHLRAVVSSSTGLRLRAEPNTDSRIIDLIPSGTTVNVLYRLSEWAKVSYGGSEGYLSIEFVELHYGQPPVNPNSLAAQIIAHGKQFLGTPYLWAGNDLRTGVDCSGFVHHVFRAFGIQLYRNSAAMTRNGVPVERNELLPGDLVFFDTVGNGGISHIGLYIGNDDFIHSSSSRRTWGVVISSLNEPYYIRTYMTARRVL